MTATGAIGRAVLGAGDLARTPVGRVAAATIAGALVAAGFPPLGLWPLVFVGAPLFWWAAAQPSLRVGFVAGFGLGVGLALSVYWFSYFGWYAMAAAFMLPASSTPFVGLLAAYLYRVGLRSPIYGVLVWVAMETLRGSWPWQGQGWTRVGYALVDFGPVRDAAAWLGVVGVGAIVAALGVGIVSILTPTWRRQGAVLVASAVGSLVVFSVLPNGTRPAGDPIDVVAIQGNWMDGAPDPGQYERRSIARNHYRLARTIEPGPELVVFPESAFEQDIAADPLTRSVLSETAQRLDATVVFNASMAHPTSRGYMNTNYAMSPNGVLLGGVPKRHLIAFGEFNPWPLQVPPISKIPDPVTAWTPRDDRRNFPHGPHQFGTLVCYEAEYHDVSLQAVRDGANFLIVAANNHSFRRSGNSAQHIQTSQMRAAELGRPVIHSSISGMSAVIDETGVVTGLTVLRGEDLLYGSITPMRGATPYSVYGNAPTLVLLAGLAISMLVHRRRSTAPAPEPLPWSIR